MTDLTVILYNRSRVCLLKSLQLLRTESFLLAFKQTSLTCTDQSNDDDRYRPRCLWTLTLSIYLSFNINGGELFKYLFESIISFDLPLLNVIFHLWAHCEIGSNQIG